MKRFLFLSSSIAFFLMTSCGLKPMVSEFQYIKTNIENIDLNDLGNGNVLIYNGADLLHKIDNTARLNIWIDNKPLGQLRPSEYVIINLENGPHHVKQVHLDVFNMKSEHEIIIDKDTKIIKVKPNLASNKLWITNEFPKNWGKFKYVEKR